jgi:aspartyl-tRNA(Asn)/glutamyl-tRNA(Gln) amidotransferase subunit A
MYLEDIYTIGVNLAGIPAVSVPIGFIRGKPYGLQLLGPQKADVAVLQAADALERNLKLTPTHPEL